MILGDKAPAMPPDPRRPTLDDLFRRTLARDPDAVALTDPPNRESFTDGAPRRLTYTEADAAASALAAKLRAMGLTPDSIVALQLPNIVDGIIALLGVLRAGLIAAPLPLLWRKAELCEALVRVGARALITCCRCGPADHGALAMRVAADTFTIRFLCCFGHEPPDGVAGLDDIFVATPSAPGPPAPVTVERGGDAAGHVAVVTFDVGPQGLVALARSHSELIAGGLAVALEARIAPATALLGALATSSFAGLSASVLPWLLSGGTLSLHQPFDATVFAAQLARERCRIAVVPGPLVAPLDQTGLFGGEDLRTVVGLWRMPELCSASATWTSPANLVDVLAFGESGVIAAARTGDGRPAAITLGPITAPRGVAGAPVLVEVARSPAGTLALGGSMVPRHPFPPALAHIDGAQIASENGLIDTGFACRPGANGALEIERPPDGTVNVGGYRFVLKELQDFLSFLGDSTVAALPDGLTGHRLVGSATDRQAARQALTEQGINPLIVNAFGEGAAEAVPDGRASAA